MKRTIPVDDITFHRALRMVSNQPWLKQIEQDMTAESGRPRRQSWEALMVLFQLTALYGDGRLLLSEVEHVAAWLTEDQRCRLGLRDAVTYSQIESALDDLAKALKETVDIKTGEVVPPRLRMSLTELMTGIISHFIPDALPASDTQSLDSTDLETHYRRRSWAHHMKPDIPEEALPEETPQEVRRAVNEAGWPKVGHDGRLRHTSDPDARDGYRSGKNLNRKDVFCGWDGHFLVDTAELGEEARPPLIRAAALAAAGTLKSIPGLDVIDTFRARNPGLTTIIADRGYSYLRPDSWALPLAHRGLQQVIDLMPNQHVSHPGPIPGTVFIDGGLFSEALPQHLRRLPMFRLNMTASEKAQPCEQYDQRLPYRFSTMGRPNPTRGTQRFRGPALAGRVRCPNVLNSMRLSPAKVPTTTCAPGGCACGATVTLGPDDSDLIQVRQVDLYGTTDWKASYGRRSQVESGNSLFRFHYARWGRGSIRVMGTIKTGILTAFLLAAVNQHTLLFRYAYDVGYPPAEGPRLLPTARPCKPALHRRRFQRRRRKRNNPCDPPAEPSPTWLSPPP